MREMVNAGVWPVDKRDVVKAVRQTENISKLGNMNPGFRAALYYDTVSRGLWVKTVAPGHKPDKPYDEKHVRLITVTYQRMGFQEMLKAIERHMRMCECDIL